MIPDPNTSNISTSSIPSANMVSTSITPSAMQNAIDYAKQDPTSSYAQELQKRIQAGSYNSVLSLMGKDTSKYGQQAPVTPTSTSTTAPAANPLMDVAQAAAGPIASTMIPTAVSDVKKIGSDLNTRVNNTSDILNSSDNTASKVLQTAGQGFGAVNDVIGDTVEGAVKQIVPQNVLDSFGAHLAPLVQSAAQSPAGQAVIKWWGGLDPETQRNLSATGSIASLLSNALGAGAAKEGITAAADAAAPVIDSAVDTAKGAVSSAKDAVIGTADEQAASQVAKTTAKATKDTASTVSALDPELKGAKLVAAQKEAITGSRTIKPATMFTEQTLSPGARTMALGQRLSSDIPLAEGDVMPKVVLSKDPVKNTTILRQALTDTEGRLTTALKGDPEINFNADKPTLYEALDSAQKTSPEEFRIGENKVVTKNVFNFANKVVANAEDSVEGLRDARTALDSQARVEYPNAFNPDGSVNVRSAAGSAIKRARDIINQHLYNTAPAGSDIQKLIAREADIFQASTPVATKAAAGAGKTVPERVIGNVRKHPVISTALAASAGVAAAKGIGI